MGCSHQMLNNLIFFLFKIKSKRKLLLTGTPLQNNIVELMSLLYFVMPSFFKNKEKLINKVFTPNEVRNECFNINFV